MRNLTNLMKKRGIKLSKSQLAAAMDIEGISVINSLAGTGKTMVLVARVCAIRELHPEANIIVLSFTKKCCEELSERLKGILNVQVSTLHSFMYNSILKAEGIYRNFSFISTEADRRTLMKKAIYDSHTEDKLLVKDLMEALAKGDFDTKEKEAAANSYFDLLKENRLLDYDAIVYFAAEILRYNMAVGRHVRNGFDYLLIDEMQDSSKSMCDVLRLLLPRESDPNLCMLLDYGQSIYGFRGAAPTSVRELCENYYQAKQLHLTINYRSTPEIINVANAVVPATNVKLVAAKNNSGVVPVFYTAGSDVEEADYVISTMKELYDSGYKYKDMAILFRASASTNTLYEKLLQQDIPFIRVGGTGLKYQNSRFKALLALLASLYNKQPSLTWQCTLPILGVSNGLMAYINSSDVVGGSVSIKDKLVSIPSLSKNQRERFQSFFAIDVNSMSFDALVELLYRKYLAAYFKVSPDDDTILNEFRDIIGKDNTYERLRDHIFEVRRREKRMKHLIYNNCDHATMLSIHACKGLQFPVVFIVGASCNCMPLNKPDADEEEEHRLAYVAVTRPEKYMVVSYPRIGLAGKVQSPSPYFAQFFD